MSGEGKGGYCQFPPQGGYGSFLEQPNIEKLRTTDGWEGGCKGKPSLIATTENNINCL